MGFRYAWFWWKLVGDNSSCGYILNVAACVSTQTYNGIQITVNRLINSVQKIVGMLEE